MESKIKVVVYGSLKKGFGNHPYHLGKAKFINYVETLPQYTMVSLGSYPGVMSGGITAIQCEMYEITNDELASLDALEGHPSYYEREEIETSEGTAYIYLLPKEEYSGYDAIESGVWEETW